MEQQRTRLSAIQGNNLLYFIHIFKATVITPFYETEPDSKCQVHKNKYIVFTYSK